MAVNYANFNDINIDDFDAVVVGSGFAGAVVAERLATQGKKKVLILEKRAQISGNMYDEYDDSGILVHRYGPHIFHTNSQKVFNYVRMFCGWIGYQHKVLADWYGTYMPVPFNKNSIEIAFGEDRAPGLIQKLVDAYGDERKVTINELRQSDDEELSEIADFVYKNVFLYYTQKQWGQTPDEVDPSVTARVPVFISRDDRYFQDTYQGMPAMGYTALFEEMLSDDNITVCLDTDATCVFDLEFEGKQEDAKLKAVKIKGKNFEGPIVYTGPLDELFLARFGRLPYRSLNFVYETFDEERKLPCGTVNYTVTEDYTRITEFKYLTGQKAPNTTIMKEYSCTYEDPDKQIPYYAILSDENIEHYNKYRALTDDMDNFYILGRLAEFKYYNMDKIIENALAMSKDILEKVN